MGVPGSRQTSPIGDESPTDLQNPRKLAGQFFFLSLDALNTAFGWVVPIVFGNQRRNSRSKLGARYAMAERGLEHRVDSPESGFRRADIPWLFPDSCGPLLPEWLVGSLHDRDNAWHRRVAVREVRP
jgi:hypothetical protein